MKRIFEKSIVIAGPLAAGHDLAHPERHAEGVDGRRLVKRAGRGELGRGNQFVAAQCGPQRVDPLGRPIGQVRQRSFLTRPLALSRKLSRSRMAGRSFGSAQWRRTCAA
jgi:hypothetical protein